MCSVSKKHAQYKTCYTDRNDKRTNEQEIITKEWQNAEGGEWERIQTYPQEAENDGDKCGNGQGFDLCRGPPYRRLRRRRRRRLFRGRGSFSVTARAGATFGNVAWRWHRDCHRGSSVNG